MEIHPCYNPISYEKPSLNYMGSFYIFKWFSPFCFKICRIFVEILFFVVSIPKIG